MDRRGFSLIGWGTGRAAARATLATGVRGQGIQALSSLPTNPRRRSFSLLRGSVFTSYLWPDFSTKNGLG